jgi:hypothetical protein
MTALCGSWQWIVGSKDQEAKAAAAPPEPRKVQLQVQQMHMPSHQPGIQRILTCLCCVLPGADPAASAADEQLAAVAAVQGPVGCPAADTQQRGRHCGEPLDDWQKQKQQQQRQQQQQ